MWDAKEDLKSKWIWSCRDQKLLTLSHIENMLCPVQRRFGQQNATFEIFWDTEGRTQGGTQGGHRHQGHKPGGETQTNTHDKYMFVNNAGIFWLQIYCKGSSQKNQSRMRSLGATFLLNFVKNLNRLVTKISPSPHYWDIFGVNQQQN